jgi:hypothetical protein
MEQQVEEPFGRLESALSELKLASGEMRGRIQKRLDAQQSEIRLCRKVPGTLSEPEEKQIIAHLIRRSRGSIEKFVKVDVTLVNAEGDGPMNVLDLRSTRTFCFQGGQGIPN